MAATDFRTLKDKNDALVMSAQDWLVLLHDWEPGASYIPTDLTDASGVLQTLPAGWFTSGEIQKAAGVSLAPDTQTSPIDGYGSSSPRRTMLTAEGFTVDYFAQEWRKKNLELWHNVDLSTVPALPGKGFRATKTSSLRVRYYSAILIAQDEGVGSLYPFFMYPKVSVSKRGAMAGEQGKELGLPATLTVFEDADFGGLYDFGVAGAGFDAIAQDAGFAAAAVSINVTPPTATLAVGEQTQMLVIDSNGFDRTAECTYATSNAARATVSASGRVTAVATGSAATITATLGALNDTAAITVA
ncbi:Ig-like domain-containing protein [Nocardia fluminea]|uniref:Ig-like protein group 2 n=1 Tax=Nocardia fluminea TaxID=134984 RepID=A0A2N3VH25_9NOCA|nr:Ig-like domain-containing protein [Nocardia fluminea]PKV80913.1 Ig-like protein group 2 [Nocardia fluminea]